MFLLLEEPPPLITHFPIVRKTLAAGQGGHAAPRVLHSPAGHEGRTEQHKLPCLMKAAAAGHKDRAAYFMLPHRGEVTAAGHEGRATLARSPVVEKALAQATQA